MCLSVQLCSRNAVCLQEPAANAHPGASRLLALTQRKYAVRVPSVPIPFVPGASLRASARLAVPARLR